ncbi:TonB-dependent receptor plug domain-containing protein [Pseudoduganella sp. UC29_106]|uniref:TonB-dependent receptor plug domain-containing protein n=1 Tax=Pseudoduganella sp. UC29_106 TaxID=3374553 RepID=UPI003757C751
MADRENCAVVWLALSGCLAGAARAQEVPPEMPTVVVTGQRASLETASRIRRNADAIVDAVVADDIDKLPDFTVNDALQRVPGVQIGRDRGEGTAVAIRGLTQMETTINGREVFTAGTGRTVDFADLPADMVAAISVYKTATADQLEGGVGGLVDLRTRRPFDFDGRVLAATARTVYGNLVGGSAPQFSVLGSQRWQLGGGEFGALLSLSSQRRAWREDQKSTAEPRLRNDLLPGQTVLAPNGDTETSSFGRRRREAASLVLQWRPQPDLELYAEGNYAQFEDPAGQLPDQRGRLAGLRRRQPGGLRRQQFPAAHQLEQRARIAAELCARYGGPQSPAGRRRQLAQRRPDAEGRPQPDHQLQ